MAQGGRLQVATRRSSRGGAEVMIRDSGKGIAADKLAQIFQPFYSDKSKGTGLGLAISKNIIDQHRAEVAVESSEGGGTTFTITFPTALDQAEVCPGTGVGE
jgi:two-component system, NtrC family, sensor histidine kinase HydH